MCVSVCVEVKMFRAYGSLPPSECNSPLSPSSVPLEPSPKPHGNEWMMAPSTVVDATQLGRSLSLFEPATGPVLDQSFPHRGRPELHRQWSASARIAGGAAVNGFDSDSDSADLSNLLANARFFKTDRAGGKARGAVGKGEHD